MRITSLTTVLFGSILISLSNIVLGDSILAFAPVTALFPEDIVVRQLGGGSCPAATQTVCPDGLGCCPRGAPCTYSRGLPVCDEPCGFGPICASGGCCQVGYVCGVTNHLCTPGLTSINVPTLPVPSVTITGTDSSTATATPGPIEATSTTAPGQGVTSPPTPTETPTLIPIGPIGDASTSPSSRASPSSSPSSSSTRSSTTSSSSTSTSTTSTVGRTTNSVQSAAPTQTGAASSLKGVNSVAALVFGWIGMLFVA